MSDTQQASDAFWWKRADTAVDAAPCAVDLKPGSECPACRRGALAYDGLFLLTCPRCGYVAASGGFT